MVRAECNTHLQRELVDGRSELTLLQGSELVEQRSCEEPSSTLSAFTTPLQAKRELKQDDNERTDDVRVDGHQEEADDRHEEPHVCGQTH